MKHGHLMQWTADLRPILSLRSTHVTIVQSTRETGDIYQLKTCDLIILQWPQCSRGTLWKFASLWTFKQKENGLNREDIK